MKKLLIIFILLPSLSFAASTNISNAAPSCDFPWEAVKRPVSGWTGFLRLCRLSVPHGWLLYTESTTATTIFVADENHEWTLQEVP